MKQDYMVHWSEMARFLLLDKAEYIYSQSQNMEIADQFINEIEQLAGKLSYVAAAYRDGQFHIFPLKNFRQFYLKTLKFAIYLPGSALLASI